MRLNQLLKHLTYEHVQGSQSREITDICYHSGNVREGSLFVCLKGLHADGHDYLQGALEAGAAAVVVAAENVVSLDNDALLYIILYYSFVTSHFKKLATQKGLEPSTSGVTGRHSNQLSY